MASFDEVLKDCTKLGTKIPTSEYLENGKYPIIDQGQNAIAGYYDSDDGLFEDVPTIVFGDHTRVVKYVDKPCFLGADGVKLLCPLDKDINCKYLFYQLSCADIPNTGYNRHFKWVKALDFKIPSSDEQNHVVEALDKVTELISLRKQQLARLDELVKARFFEMFGEISDNSMNWDCFTIGKLISTIESGWSGNGKQREKHADEIAVLKVSAVTKGYFIPTECKVLDDQHNIKKYVYPQKGDILFSRANTKEMVGATVLIKKDYPDLILPDKLWKIRFCTDVNPIYMKHVLSTTTVRNAFSAASTGTSGSMYNVSMEKFKGVIIPVPPLPVQNEFVAFAECVDQQKQTVQQSLEKLELMKKALMQEYFG